MVVVFAFVEVFLVAAAGFFVGIFFVAGFLADLVGVFLLAIFFAGAAIAAVHRVAERESLGCAFYPKRCVAGHSARYLRP